MLTPSSVTSACGLENNVFDSVTSAGWFGKYVGTGCQIWGQNLSPVLTKT